MDAVENAIRTALARGDATDRAFREKVYRSVFSALERASSSNSPVSPEIAAKRRQVLAEKIREIETAYIRAEIDPNPPSSDSAPEPEMRSRPVEPVARAESASDIHSEAADEPDEPVFSRKRRPFTLLLIASLVIAALGMGAWWVYQSGLMLSDAERDTRVPNPPRTLSEEDFKPDPGGSPALREQAEENRVWIGIFSPDDPSSVVATSGATAEIADDGRGQVLRIRSSTKEAAVMFDVGQGILEQIAGKKAVFDIVASSEEGKPTQISVRCNFGDLGDCVRRRYDIVATPSEFLFELELPDASPGASGTIAIVSDINGSGLAVDIREIKVSASP